MVFSNRFLAKASIYIAIGGISSVMIMRSILLDKVRRQDYFKEAMKELRNHQGAKSMLGEPIKEVGLDLGEPNYANQEKAHFEVKVKGPTAKATMFFWAEKESEAWNVSRIELQLKDDEDKRLIIKKPIYSQNI